MSLNSNKSKRLAYLLRHDCNYNFEIGGWRDVSDLCLFHSFTLDEIIDIVSTDHKGRFAFNDDMTKVRALYGHSIKTDLMLSNDIPPRYLFHGTAIKYIESIHQNGLKSQSRQFVHLSEDSVMATKTGSRHGQSVLLVIDAHTMSRDGYLFFQTGNQIWLTKEVPIKYISQNIPDAKI